MTDRVLFERAGEGRRTVRGAVVKKIQNRLTQLGCDTSGLDGVFGRATENAVRDFQRKQGAADHGAVTEAVWAALFPGEACPVKDRCLQLTADFEGHGFGKAVGDFDNAGLTWGIIGFTLKNGEVQAILNEVARNHASCLDSAFGGLASQLRKMLAADRPQQMDWARSISLGTQRYKILAEWAEAFEALGDFPEVQALQMARVEQYWAIATRDFKHFGLATERGLALCFDVAVQNGGLDKNEREDAAWEERKKPGRVERDRLALIGNVVADHSSATWREAVRRRKITLATGAGTVNGAEYALRSWGIEDLAV